MSDTISREVERARATAQATLDAALALANDGDPSVPIEFVAPLSVAASYCGLVASEQKSIPAIDGGDQKAHERVAAFLMDRWLDLANDFELADLERWEEAKGRSG